MVNGLQKGTQPIGSSLPHQSGGAFYSGDHQHVVYVGLFPVFQGVRVIQFPLQFLLREQES